MILPEIVWLDFKQILVVPGADWYKTTVRNEFQYKKCSSLIFGWVRNQQKSVPGQL